MVKCFQEGVCRSFSKGFFIYLMQNQRFKNWAAWGVQAEGVPVPVIRHQWFTKTEDNMDQAFETPDIGWQASKHLLVLRTTFLPRWHLMRFFVFWGENLCFSASMASDRWSFCMKAERSGPAGFDSNLWESPLGSSIITPKHGVTHVQEPGLWPIRGILCNRV